MTKVLSVRTIYKGWLSLLMVRLRAPGGDEFDRHGVELGRAAAVLPYDPERRTALLVSMPRAAVAMRTGPDMLEAIAGSLDGDAPEVCARKEALEEAGVRLDMLERIGRFWPTPSAILEEIDYFVAPYRLEDRVSAGGGCDGEMENITVHEIGLDELWTRLDGDRIKDGKLVTLLMALRIRHQELFGEAP